MTEIQQFFSKSFKTIDDLVKARQIHLFIKAGANKRVYLLCRCQNRSVLENAPDLLIVRLFHKSKEDKTKFKRLRNSLPKYVKYL